MKVKNLNFSEVQGLAFVLYELTYGKLDEKDVICANISEILDHFSQEQYEYLYNILFQRMKIVNFLKKYDKTNSWVTKQRTKIKRVLTNPQIAAQLSASVMANKYANLQARCTELQGTVAKLHTDNLNLSLKLSQLGHLPTELGIELLGFSVHATNALVNGGIKTIPQLMNIKHVSELEAIRNFGNKCFENVVLRMNELGFTVWVANLKHMA